MSNKYCFVQELPDRDAAIVLRNISVPCLFGAVVAAIGAGTFSARPNVNAALQEIAENLLPVLGDNESKALYAMALAVGKSRDLAAEVEKAEKQVTAGPDAKLPDAADALAAAAAAVNAPAPCARCGAPARELSGGFPVCLDCKRA